MTRRLLESVSPAPTALRVPPLRATPNAVYPGRVQRCEVTELAPQECAHCRTAAPPATGHAPSKPETKWRPPPPRRARNGRVGRRSDGRYPGSAHVESKCEACQLPVMVDDLVVRDDFGQWVHDGCCPSIELGGTAERGLVPATASTSIRAGAERPEREQARRRQRLADMPVPPGALEVYTDGACSGNPGPGGWAWVVDDGRRGAGSEPATTNQRMEIRAALEAVRALPGALVVVSDSTYVVNCFRDGWWRRWRDRNWVTTANKPVANRDLWEPLIELVEARGDIAFRWVKGHSGNRLNDLADKLAVTAGLNQTRA